mmetsp:Transcript_7643/g.8776  ORF Transcript_7643/g.8776 Transcript_7643/m.8776 type:complete len:373 (-) Transcript_7643:546-1664(-)|eukprot:CAMPEP_0184028376 /NCGR_PEP_ID=MMETSP0954-20121128/14795_1 /TAXON_ID=627963 /ORGANISM="Aplanochytrium sp, Strain PBS07" /LENGTH=372 /DNA_ID=CAMNT_0026313191 /DNA_START=45 /DNA_END=1163 /DNA_ORIENTATION=+
MKSVSSRSLKVAASARKSIVSLTTSAKMSLSSRSLKMGFKKGKLEFYVRKHPVKPLAVSEFFKNFELSDEVVGKGAEGEVKTAIEKSTGKTRAVKIVEKEPLTKADLADVHREIFLMKAMDHPNVIKCYEHYEDGDRIYIVMEYIKGGELFHGLESVKHYTEENVVHIVRTLAKALKYCSDRGIIHRDVKAENILLKEDDTNSDIVLVDFGFAAHVKKGLAGMSELKTKCGTPLYIAPEIVRDEEYNFKCDIWSLGVVACVLLAGVPPIPATTQTELFQKLKFQETWEFEPAIAWAKVSDLAKDFLKKVLEFDPEDRYDYDQILAHPWISGDNVYEHVLETEHLKEFNKARKKILTAAQVYEVAEVFRNIMR